MFRLRKQVINCTSKCKKTFVYMQIFVVFYSTHRNSAALNKQYDKLADRNSILLSTTDIYKYTHA